MELFTRNLALAFASHLYGAFAAVIASGREHSCALVKSGSIRCWGNNTFGQTLAPSGKFVAVFAGGQHSCGIRKSGDSVCWGDDRWKQLGQNVFTRAVFKTLALGSHHTCGILKHPKNNLACWGFNGHGRVKAPQDSGEYFDIVAKGGHNCALNSAGQATCWGMNDNGQTDSPKKEQFKKLSAGISHTCGLKKNGAVVCWGNKEIAGVVPQNKFMDISGYGYFNCGILADSRNVKCWPQSRDPPAGPYGALAAGAQHACAVHVSGKIECWGQPPAHEPPEGTFQTEADSKLKPIEISSAASEL